MPRRSSAIALSISLLCGCGASAPPSAELIGEKTESTDATELFRRGRAAAERGDTVRAEQYLSMAIEHGYSEQKVLPIMLRVCLSSSRLRAALNHAEPYLREHPNDQGLRYLVATIHLGLGQLDEARFELRHVLRVDPNHAKAHYLLGVLESGNDTEQALEHFRRYLELVPTGAHALEVKSRMMDLAVRGDLGRPRELTAVEHAGLVAPADDAPSKAGEHWFGQTNPAAPRAAEP